MTDKIDWKYNHLSPSHKTFLLMEESASHYPWQPEHKRFGNIMFYHYIETLGKISALEIFKEWKMLGYRIRTTKTRTRTIPGVKHGSYLRGSDYYHVWVADKSKK
jgi:hypothetical protein